MQRKKKHKIQKKNLLKQNNVFMMSIKYLYDIRENVIFFGNYIDLPPEAPSFITRVCGFSFHILLRQFEQARRVRSPQISQALGALQRVFGCAEMSAV